MSKLKTELQRARDAQLAEWLRIGLARTGKRKSALAEALGLDAGAISKLLKGAREFKEAEILQIAEFIGMPPPPLSDRVSSRVVETLPVGWAQPTVIIAPDVWRRKGAPVNISERIPLSADPRLEGISQYVCKIEGAKEYAVCVPFAAFRKAPLVGDLLHVRRAQGDLIEDTLRRVISIVGGTVVAPHDEPDERENLPQDNTVELAGLVVGFFSPISIGIS